MARIAINGFGRIGRCVLRAALERGEKDLEFVSINDLTDTKTLAHLLKYDSVHGVLDAEVKASEKGIVVNGKEIQVTAIKIAGRAAARRQQGRPGARVHRPLHRARRRPRAPQGRRAQRSLISAPAKNPDITIAFGINHQQLDKAKHKIISNASCTTNCLTPVAKVLLETFGIKRGLMTTIHSYTNDQNLLDLPHKDLRRARAAALSMIPSTTGAAKAVAEVIPALKGKLHGTAVRVPTPNVSLVDLTVELEKPATDEEINAAFKKAAEGALKGVLEYSEDPTVSIDYNGNPASSIFDATNTFVIDGNFAKVFAWYDNEWGFSNRMVDVAKFLTK